ncbi:MAG: conjugal transfer protein TraH [Pseudomonadota bacterium]
MIFRDLTYFILGAIFMAMAMGIMGLMTTVNAQVQSKMDDFWNDLGASANVTGPTAFDGQAAGYYALGNIFYRAPQRTTQLATLNLPSYSAGCGGIDFFAGSFSFVNSAELVALGKAIANNAAGFVFQVALETITPVIAEKISELNDLAQKINQASINSCETAQALVGSAWPKTDRASKVICEQIGASTGVFSDYAAARHGCGSEGNRTAVLAGASGPEADLIPINVNLTWNGLMAHPTFAADTEFAEFLMTISGTQIMVSGASDSDPGTYRVLPAMVIDEGVIATLLDGGDLEIHRCDEPAKCLNPAEFDQTIAIAANRALRQRVEVLLDDMLTKIRTDEALTAEMIDFLNVASIPVYKMLNVYSAYNGVFASSTIPQYAEIIAIDLVYLLLDDALEQVEQAAARVQAGEADLLDQWRDNLIDSRRALREHRMQSADHLDVVFAAVERVQLIESLLASRLSVDMSDSFEFSKRLDVY